MNEEQAGKLVDRADQAGEIAAARVLSLLSTMSVSAMVEAIRSVAGDSGGGIDETRRDLAEVRAKLSSSFSNTEKALSFLIQAQMGTAITAGFVAEVEAQNEALPEGTNIKPDKAESLQLADLPVLGNTRYETAQHVSSSWRFAVEGDVGKAAAIGDATTLPPAIMDTNRKTANQVSNAVSEAWAAGQGAARRAIGVALSRMVRGA